MKLSTYLRDNWPNAAISLAGVIFTGALVYARVDNRLENLGRDVGQIQATEPAMSRYRIERLETSVSSLEARVEQSAAQLANVNVNLAGINQKVDFLVQRERQKAE